MAVLSKLGELTVSEANIPDIKLLRSRLEWLHAFVLHSEQRRRAGSDESTWETVCQIRDMAFVAEDALDDFFNEEVRPPVIPCSKKVE